MTRKIEQFEIDFVNKCDQYQLEGLPMTFKSMYSLIESASLIAEITDKNIQRVYDTWEIDFHPVVCGKFIVKIHPVGSGANFTVKGINNHFILDTHKDENE
jgi:hypothetical protein